MCGIYGEVGGRKIVRSLVMGLDELKGRGQEGTGIHYTINGSACLTIKGDGLPLEVVEPNKFSELEGLIKPKTTRAGIGHTRYRTSGAKEEAKQPIVLKNAVVHNGNIFGYNNILEELHQRNFPLPRKDYSDTELLARLILSSNQATLEQKIIETIDIVTPTLNIIVQDGSRLYVYKDPTNCHPLSIGRIGKQGFAVASEETALHKRKAYDIKDIKPGQFLILEKGKKSWMQLYKPWEHRCIFEDVYLSAGQKKGGSFKPKLWGQDITEQRKEGGRCLWNHFPQRRNLENCIAAYGPDTGYWAAQGFSEASHIPLSKAIRSKTKKRGFIQSTQEKRQRMSAYKYDCIRDMLYGKIVYFVDDSLVRGTTMWDMVKRLRLNGVYELDVCLASSKIHSPCYYGMNFPTYRELLGSHLRKDQIELFYAARFLGYDGSKERLIRQIKEEKGLNYILNNNKNYLGSKNRKLAYDPDNQGAGRFSLRYLTQKEMERTYGDEKHYCQACFTGKHWTEEWDKVKDDLKIKNRRWQYERIAA